MKRALAVLGAVLLLCTGCHESPEPQATAEPTPTAVPTETPFPEEGHLLVALGDSITAGYGLENAAKQRFSAQLCTLLSRQDNAQWLDENYGVSGDDSTDLLALLKTDGAVPTLEKAESIAVCIGANNLLRPATMLLEGLQVPSADMAAIMKSFNAAVSASMARLESDLTEIMAILRERNPQAGLYLMTVYNPFEGNPLQVTVNGIPWTMGALADINLNMLNTKLKQHAESDGYTTVDVNAAFAGSCAALVNDTQVYKGVNDPHPNEQGHRRIAQAFFDVMRP